MSRDPTVLWVLFGFDGRIDRQVFWLGFALTVLVAYVLVLPTADPSTGLIQMSPLAPFVFIAGMWSQFALAVKRLHDNGYSGWFAIIFAVPLVNFLAFIAIGLMPGHNGPNPFGPASNRRGV